MAASEVEASQLGRPLPADIDTDHAGCSAPHFVTDVDIKRALTSVLLQIAASPVQVPSDIILKKRILDGLAPLLGEDGNLTPMLKAAIEADQLRVEKSLTNVLADNAPNLLLRSTPTPVFRLPVIPSMDDQGLEDGQRFVWCYFAGATHLMNFLQPIGVTAFKIGITGTREPQARIEDLRRKRYGSFLLSDSVAIEPHTAASMTPLEGSEEWFLSPMKLEHLKGMAMPGGITLEDGVLRLHLPAGVTVRQVDEAVHDRLRERSLRNFLSTVEGQKRLRACGHDPSAWFYTSYTLMGCTPRLSAAEEIYAIRPREELADFVSELADLLGGLKPAKG